MWIASRRHFRSRLLKNIQVRTAEIFVFVVSPYILLLLYYKYIRRMVPVGAKAAFGRTDRPLFDCLLRPSLHGN